MRTQQSRTAIMTRGGQKVCARCSSSFFARFSRATSISLTASAPYQLANSLRQGRARVGLPLGSLEEDLPAPLVQRHGDALRVRRPALHRLQQHVLHLRIIRQQASLSTPHSNRSLRGGTTVELLSVWGCPVWGFVGPAAHQHTTLSPKKRVN